MTKMRFSLGIGLLLIGWVLALSNPVPAHASGWVTGTTCTDGGCRDYKLWVPSGYDGHKPLPLFVMLHGCLLDADSFAAATRMNALAEQFNFLVLYPQQSPAANAAKCWNWFLPANQARDSGEAGIIASAVRTIRAQYKVHPQRVFAAGLSAGGAMAVILGATYPEVFPAIGVVAGLEFKAATDPLSAWLAMTYGGPDPALQGLAAYQAMGKRARVVKVILFQGTSDGIVNPVNGDQTVAQWATTNDYADDGVANHSVTGVAVGSQTGTVPDGYSYTRYFYVDGDADRLMEKWIVTGMAHAWPGGAADILYSDPKGPDASLLMCEFFRVCRAGNGQDD